MAEGATGFHLGGGLREGDALHKFKRSLGGDALPFQVARCILDSVRYQRLCAARAKLTARTSGDLVATGQGTTAGGATLSSRRVALALGSFINLSGLLPRVSVDIVRRPLFW